MAGRQSVPRVCGLLSRFLLTDTCKGVLSRVQSTYRLCGCPGAYQSMPKTARFGGYPGTRFGRYPGTYPSMPKTTGFGGYPDTYPSMGEASSFVGAQVPTRVCPKLLGL